MAEDARLAALEQFYAAYNAHDVAAAVALYAADGAHEEAATGQARTGAEALAQGLSGFFAMLAEARFERRDTVLAGPHAAVGYRMTGRMARDLGPLACKGRAIEIIGLHLFEFAEGKIRRTRDFWDPDAFKRQIAAETRA